MIEISSINSNSNLGWCENPNRIRLDDFRSLMFDLAGLVSGSVVASLMFRAHDHVVEVFPQLRRLPNATWWTVNPHLFDTELEEINMTFWGPGRCTNMGERKGNLMHLVTRCHRISMIWIVKYERINIIISAHSTAFVINKWSNCIWYLHSKFTSRVFSGVFGPPWPPATSPSYFFCWGILSWPVPFNWMLGHLETEQLGHGLLLTNGIRLSQGFGMNEVMLFLRLKTMTGASSRQIRLWFFLAPVGLLALKSSDTGHGVGFCGWVPFTL